MATTHEGYELVIRQHSTEPLWTCEIRKFGRFIDEIGGWKNSPEAATRRARRIVDRFPDVRIKRESRPS